MNRRLISTFLVLAGLLAGERARAGEPPAADDKNVFKINKVTCFKKERKIEVEGKVCLQEGPLEYLAVLSGGKEYESVLTINCKALDLNVALLGLGYVAGGGSVRKLGDASIPKGDPLYLSVEYADKDGKTQRVRLEDLVFNNATKKPMRRTAWVFTGSEFLKDEDTGKLIRDPDTNTPIFRAEAERNLVAVYRDPGAVFNSPLDTGVDGIYYSVNKAACPKVGTPVKLILEPAPKEALDPENLKDGADLFKREPGKEYAPPKQNAAEPKKDAE